MYRAMAIPACRRFDRQRAVYAFVLERLSAGRSMPARIAMIAITTNNSISVNAPFDLWRIRSVAGRTAPGRKIVAFTDVTLSCEIKAVGEYTRRTRRVKGAGIALHRSMAAVHVVGAASINTFPREQRREITDEKCQIMFVAWIPTTAPRHQRNRTLALTPTLSPGEGGLCHPVEKCPPPSVSSQHSRSEFPSHEPSRLRVTDPRSGPRLCEAQRFMVPMRAQKRMEALHEPGGARLRRALIFYPLDQGSAESRPTVHGPNALSIFWDWSFSMHRVTADVSPRTLK